MLALTFTVVTSKIPKYRFLKLLNLWLHWHLVSAFFLILLLQWAVFLFEKLLYSNSNLWKPFLQPNNGVNILFHWVKYFSGWYRYLSLFSKSTKIWTTKHMRIIDIQKTSVILKTEKHNTKRMKNLNTLKNGESIREGLQMVMYIAMDMFQSRAGRLEAIML